MFLTIMIVIAAWFLQLPLAIQILITIAGALHCIYAIGRALYRAYKKAEKEL